MSEKQKKNNKIYFRFITYTFVPTFFLVIVVMLFFSIHSYPQTKKELKQKMDNQKELLQQKQDFRRKWFSDLIDLGKVYPELGTFNISWDDYANYDFSGLNNRANEGVYLNMIKKQYNFSIINWGEFASHPIVSAFNKAKIFSTLDYGILTDYNRRASNRFPDINSFGPYFSKYASSVDEFQRHRLEESVKGFIMDRLHQLLNAPYFIFPRCIVHLGSYSFTNKGFPYDVDDLTSNYIGTRTSLWRDETPIHYSLINIKLFGDTKSQSNLLPDVIPMDEIAAQNFLRDFPNRIVMAYILCKPVSETFSGHIFVKISHIIFANQEGKVLFIHSNEKSMKVELTPR